MESHLLQMRGLKPMIFPSSSTVTTVASFTDAWIETGFRIRQGFKYGVASFTDAWIETNKDTSPHIAHNCRIFYRCVD